MKLVCGKLLKIQMRKCHSVQSLVRENVMLFGRKHKTSNGPGKLRYRIVVMLKEQLNICVEAHEIKCNNDPTSRLEDVARWDVFGVQWLSDGSARKVHVCSWDNMRDIIKSGYLAVVDDNPSHFEVCKSDGKV